MSASHAVAEDIEDRAIRLVAEAIASVPQQCAMASAIARHAGNALARLSTNEDSFLLHTNLARRHQEKMRFRGATR